MKLEVFTKGKKWEFTDDKATWLISESWVEVKTKYKTFLFPVHNVNLLIVSEEEQKEKAQVYQQGGNQK